MARKLNLFLLTVSAIMMVWYLYLGHQLITFTDFFFWLKTLLWVLFALPFLNIIWLPLSYWSAEESSPSPLREFLAASAYYWMGFLSFVLFFVVARDLLVLISSNFSLYSSSGSLFILCGSFLLFALGLLGARVTPQVTTVTVPLRNLPPEFDGFRIAQISDLHIGSHVRSSFAKKVVSAVNQTKPDIVALTGDIFDSEPKEFTQEAQPLADLQPREGSYYVTGNHEYYWDAAGWIAVARQLKLTPLLNSHIVLKRGNAQMIIAGTLDAWAHRSGLAEGADPKKALENAPSGAIKILLAHQPSGAPLAASLGYDLQLSGHTHGGQFLPWTLLVRLFHKFTRGLHRVDHMWIYVNRGTGFWGPPVRLGSRSEITLLTLRILS